MTKTQQNQINFICKKLSYNVAVLYIEGQREFLIYSFFEASISNNTASVDFCSFTGINVTELLSSCSIDPYINELQFVNLFKSVIETGSEVGIKINKIIPYVLYTTI